MLCFSNDKLAWCTFIGIHVTSSQTASPQQPVSSHLQHPKQKPGLGLVATLELLLRPVHAPCSCTLRHTQLLRLLLLLLLLYYYYCYYYTIIILLLLLLFIIIRTLERTAEGRESVEMPHQGACSLLLHPAAHTTSQALMRTLERTVEGKKSVEMPHQGACSLLLHPAPCKTHNFSGSHSNGGQRVCASALRAMEGRESVRVPCKGCRVKKQ